MSTPPVRDRKVLVLSPELPAPDSGGSFRALQHLHLLNQLGCKPYLLTFFQEGQEAAVERMRGLLNELTEEATIVPAPMPAPDGVVGKLARNARYLAPPGPWWRRRGYEKGRYPLARAFDAAGAGEHLFRIVQEREIKVLIVTHAWLLHYVRLLRARVPSLVIVLDLVDLDSDFSAQLLLAGGTLTQRARHLVSWLTARRLERTYFPMCDEFWAIAPTEAEKIRRICNDRPTPVLPDMLDVDRVRPCESDGFPGCLLFVGSLFFAPNENAAVHLMTRLYPAIRRAMPTAHLTIVGRGASPTVERLARQTPGVRLTGYVPATRPYYEDAQVVVAPIREGCGIRLKVLEALAMGRAVVATPKAAEGLDLVDGTHLVVARSDDEFVDQTLDLLRRPERRRALAREGRALVESRYSWREAERIMATQTCLRYLAERRGTTPLESGR